MMPSVSAVPFLVAFLALTFVPRVLTRPARRRLAVEAHECRQAMPASAPAFPCGFKARTPWRISARYLAGEMKVDPSAIVFRNTGGLGRPAHQEAITVRRDDTSMIIDVGRMVFFQKYRFVSEPHSVVIYLRFSDLTEVLSTWSLMGWPDPHHHRGLIEGRRGRGH
jgi:hypothetical protein